MRWSPNDASQVTLGLMELGWGHIRRPPTQTYARHTIPSSDLITAINAFLAAENEVVFEVIQA